MASQIRVDSVSSQMQEVPLNGVTFFFKIYVNQFYKNWSWVMDIYDQDKNPLLTGKRITAGTNLTGLSRSLTDLLDGWVFCENTQATRDPIALDNFGTDKAFQLRYYSRQEVLDASTST